MAEHRNSRRAGMSAVSTLMAALAGGPMAAPAEAGGQLIRDNSPIELTANKPTLDSVDLMRLPNRRTLAAAALRENLGRGNNPSQALTNLTPEQRDALATNAGSTPQGFYAIFPPDNVVGGVPLLVFQNREANNLTVIFSGVPINPDGSFNPADVNPNSLFGILRGTQVVSGGIPAELSVKTAQSAAANLSGPDEQRVPTPRTSVQRSIPGTQPGNAFTTMTAGRPRDYKYTPEELADLQRRRVALMQTITQHSYTLEDIKRQWPDQFDALITNVSWGDSTFYAVGTNNTYNVPNIFVYQNDDKDPAKRKTVIYQNVPGVLPRQTNFLSKNNLSFNSNHLNDRYRAYYPQVNITKIGAVVGDQVASGRDAQRYFNEAARVAELLVGQDPQVKYERDYIENDMKRRGTGGIFGPGGILGGRGRGRFSPEEQQQIGDRAVESFKEQLLKSEKGKGRE